jgi:hypothetical protein
MPLGRAFYSKQWHNIEMEFPTRHAYLKVFSKTAINTHERLMTIDSLEPASNVLGLSGARPDGFHHFQSQNLWLLTLTSLSRLQPLPKNEIISSNGLWCELYAGSETNS